ncbi:hypothetical protein HPB47_013898 [Ixodes persulcatus]|uniref:Uncharacterized protein n=1 Tax=Ixodes persulcatus TaxID=34615 RepID=A0AC60QXN2_IXOPE|nr:hypothetical protein HPB47_013898 [Ixodes persulcatus]
MSRIQISSLEDAATTRISKCAYCLLLPLLFWAFDSTPKPAMAMLHVVTLPLLNLFSTDQIAAQYMSLSVSRGCVWRVLRRQMYPFSAQLWYELKPQDFTRRAQLYEDELVRIQANASHL